MKTQDLSQQIQRVVVTGGPCAGKTTALKAIEKVLADQVVLVPEAATSILSSGFSIPGRDVQWSQEWQDALQTAITSLQPCLENAWELTAAQQAKPLLVCDRGLLDGAAYTPGGIDSFCRRYGIDQEKALARYHAVIHLESLATGKPEAYGAENNSTRFESLEEAHKLEFATREAWAKHPNRIFISCQESAEYTAANVIKLLKDLLS